MGLSGNGIIRRLQFWGGILAVVLLAISIISGLGWDLFSSDLISHLTGGLLNRLNSAELHRIVVIPLILLLLLHVAPRLKGRRNEA